MSMLRQHTCGHFIVVNSDRGIKLIIHSHVKCSNCLRKERDNPVGKAQRDEAEDYGVEESK